MNGDLVLLRSPRLSDTLEVVQFGIVLCNSVVAVGDGPGGRGGGEGGGGRSENSDQICVLLRRPSTSEDLEAFSKLTETCLSNFRNPKMQWQVENVHNLTTSAREYQAIRSLAFCSQQVQKLILSGQMLVTPSTSALQTAATAATTAAASAKRLSPGLFQELKSKYNDSQLQAILGAVGDDQYLLIQGPVSVEKTKRFFTLSMRKN